jgi:hypothetical protein
MSQLSDLFATIERLLFELITWFILIPKTLYLILAHPSKVPDYVRGELDLNDNSRARFDGSISPVFLFLLIAIGPFLLLTVIDLPKLTITAPESAYAKKNSEFTAHLIDVPTAVIYRTVWTIGDKQQVYCQDLEGYKGDCNLLEQEIAWDVFYNLLAQYEPKLTISQIHEELTVSTKLYGDIFYTAAEKRALSLNNANVILGDWCLQPSDNLELVSCEQEIDAIDMFIKNIDEGNTIESSVSKVQDSFDDATAKSVYERYEALYMHDLGASEKTATGTLPFDGQTAYKDITLLDLRSSSPDSSMFVNASMKLMWNSPGFYTVSLEVFDYNNGELLDIADSIDIWVKHELSAQENKRRSEDKVKAKEVDLPHQQDKKDLFFKAIQSSETMGLAIGFLIFPLIFAMATLLGRGKSLTQATIKPAFYIQCLYLSPFILSIWLPYLLINYAPRAVLNVGLATWVLFIIAIWWFFAELSFIKKDRAISGLKALFWLALPLLFIFVTFICLVFVIDIHRYDIAEGLAKTMMSLMLLTIATSILRSIWKRLFGKN